MRKIVRCFACLLGITWGMLALQGKGVQAASIPASAISVDYDAQRLQVKQSDKTDLQIYFNVPKIKTVKKKNVDGTIDKKSVLTSSTWECYENTAAGVTIDLSTLNRAKDNYIQVKGDQTADPVTIKIPAILSKVSASYDAVADQVTMNDITDKKNPVPIQNKTFEYRVGNSGWKTYAGDDFTYYQVRGVSMYFRIVADAKAALQASALTTLTDLYDTNDQQVRAYVVGRFPGKEVKFRVAKQASAPKITVDYARHQFKLPKNTEYRVTAGGKQGTWAAADATAVKYLNLSEIAGQIGKNTSASLEVRVKAVSNKPASRASRVDFEMPTAAPVVHTRDTNTSSNLVNLDIYDNWVGQDPDDPLLTTGYRYRQYTKEFQGVCLFNLTTEKFEVYISKDGKAPVASSAILSVTPQVASKVGIEKETLLPSTKVKNGDRIYIRRKADTKNKVFSSYFAGLGTVDFQPDQMN